MEGAWVGRDKIMRSGGRLLGRRGNLTPKVFCTDVLWTPGTYGCESKWNTFATLWHLGRDKKCIYQGLSTEAGGGWNKVIRVLIHRSVRNTGVTEKTSDVVPYPSELFNVALTFLFGVTSRVGYTDCFVPMSSYQDLIKTTRQESEWSDVLRTLHCILHPSCGYILESRLGQTSFSVLRRVLWRKEPVLRQVGSVAQIPVLLMKTLAHGYPVTTKTFHSRNMNMMLRVKTDGEGFTTRVEETLHYPWGFSCRSRRSHHPRDWPFFCTPKYWKLSLRLFQNSVNNRIRSVITSQTRF